MAHRLTRSFLKVLVVDDSSTVRAQVREALGGEEYIVVEAVDGVEGFAALESHPDIDVLICDVNMPRLSGLELLSKLRAAGKDVPVVMLTTEGQPDLIQQARAQGARGWMVKPFQPVLLRKAIDRLAGRAED